MINLFHPVSSTLIARNVLEKRWRADLQRRNDAEVRLDLYMDNYEKAVKDVMKQLYCIENYDKMQWMINGSQNLIKRVINEISMVYKVEAKRTLVGPDGKAIDCPRYDQLKETLDLPIKMKKVNRFTNLMNETMIKISVRDDEIHYDVITPNVCGAIQDENDTTRPVAIWFQRIVFDKEGLPRMNYYYYDESGASHVLDYNFTLKEVFYDPDDTPYRYADGRTFLPFVICHREQPDDVIWNQDTGRDLVSATLALHLKNTLLDYYFKNASHKQIYMIGENIKLPSKQILDPLTVLTAQHGPHGTAQIGTLDLQNRMVELVTALTYQINGVINNYGISADAWSMKVSEVSGRALKIRNRALLEAREDQLPVYRRNEDELFRKTRAINNNLAASMGWEEIPEDAQFSIDFGEIDFPEDPAIELDLMTRKLQMGIVSLGQFLQYFDPDISSEDDATKKITERLDALAKLRDKDEALDKMLSEIFGEVGGGGGKVQTAVGEPAPSSIAGVPKGAV